MDPLTSLQGYGTNVKQILQYPDGRCVEVPFTGDESLIGPPPNHPQLVTVSAPPLQRHISVPQLIQASAPPVVHVAGGMYSQPRHGPGPFIIRMPILPNTPPPVLDSPTPAMLPSPAIPIVTSTVGLPPTMHQTSRTYIRHDVTSPVYGLPPQSPGGHCNTEGVVMLQPGQQYQPQRNDGVLNLSITRDAHHHQHMYSPPMSSQSHALPYITTSYNIWNHNSQGVNQPSVIRHTANVTPTTVTVIPIVSSNANHGPIHIIPLQSTSNDMRYGGILHSSHQPIMATRVQDRRSPDIIAGPSALFDPNPSLYNYQENYNGPSYTGTQQHHNPSICEASATANPQYPEDDFVNNMFDMDGDADYTARYTVEPPLKHSDIGYQLALEARVSDEQYPRIPSYLESAPANANIDIIRQFDRECISNNYEIPQSSPITTQPEGVPVEALHDSISYQFLQDPLPNSGKQRTPRKNQPGSMQAKATAYPGPSAAGTDPWQVHLPPDYNLPVAPQENVIIEGVKGGKARGRGRSKPSQSRQRKPKTSVEYMAVAPDGGGAQFPPSPNDIQIVSVSSLEIKTDNSLVETMTDVGSDLHPLIVTTDGHYEQSGASGEMDFRISSNIIVHPDSESLVPETVLKTEHVIAIDHSQNKKKSQSRRRTSDTHKQSQSQKLRKRKKTAVSEPSEGSLLVQAPVHSTAVLDCVNEIYSLHMKKLKDACNLESITQSSPGNETSLVINVGERAPDHASVSDERFTDLIVFDTVSYENTVSHVDTNVSLGLQGLDRDETAANEGVQKEEAYDIGTKVPPQQKKKGQSQRRDSETSPKRPTPNKKPRKQLKEMMSIATIAGGIVSEQLPLVSIPVQPCVIEICDEYTKRFQEQNNLKLINSHLSADSNMKSEENAFESNSQPINLNDATQSLLETKMSSQDETTISSNEQDITGGLIETAETEHTMDETIPQTGELSETAPENELESRGGSPQRSSHGTPGSKKRCSGKKGRHSVSQNEENDETRRTTRSRSAKLLRTESSSVSSSSIEADTGSASSPKDLTKSDELDETEKEVVDHSDEDSSLVETKKTPYKPAPLPDERQRSSSSSENADIISKMECSVVIEPMVRPISEENIRQSLIGPHARPIIKAVRRKEPNFSRPPTCKRERKTIGRVQKIIPSQEQAEEGNENEDPVSLDGPEHHEDAQFSSDGDPDKKASKSIISFNQIRQAYTDEEKKRLYADKCFVMDLSDYDKEPEDMCIWQICVSDRCLRQYFPSKCGNVQTFMSSPVNWYFDEKDFLSAKFHDKFQPIPVIILKKDATKIKRNPNVRVREPVAFSTFTDDIVHYVYFDKSFVSRVSKTMGQLYKTEALRRPFMLILPVLAYQVLDHLFIRNLTTPNFACSGWYLEENRKAWNTINRKINSVIESVEQNCDLTKDILATLKLYPKFCYSYKSVKKDIFCPACLPKNRMPSHTVTFGPNNTTHKPYDYATLIELEGEDAPKETLVTYFCRACSITARKFSRVYHFMYQLNKLLYQNMAKDIDMLVKHGKPNPTPTELLWLIHVDEHWKNSMFLDFQVRIAEAIAEFRPSSLKDAN